MHRKAFDKLDTLSALAFLSHLKTGCWTVSSHSKLSDKPNTEEQAGMIWDVKPKSRRWCIELTASIRNERIISDHQAKHSLAKVLMIASLDQRIMPNAKCPETQAHRWLVSWTKTDVENIKKALLYQMQTSKTVSSSRKTLSTKSDLASPTPPKRSGDTKCPVKHKPLQKGSFSFHSSQNIYTCHFKTSALLIVSFVDTKLNARIKPECCFQPTIEPKCKMSPWPNSALKTCVTHWHTQMESAREKSVPQCFLVDADRPGSSPALWTH